MVLEDVLHALPRGGDPGEAWLQELAIGFLREGGSRRVRNPRFPNTSH